MTSDLDADDPEYDLDVEEKDRLEKSLRETARHLLKAERRKNAERHWRERWRFRGAEHGGPINENGGFQYQRFSLDESVVSGAAGSRSV
jgi:hypothetical protein